MFLKEIVRKIAILGMSFGLVASPLALAHSSIELNQDRSAGENVIEKPQSGTNNDNHQFSAGALNRDEGDSLDFSPSSRLPSAETETSRRTTGYSSNNLNRKEGDSTDW